MSFEVFSRRAGRPDGRLPEVFVMLDILESEPGLTARIDMDRTNMHNLARRLGYRVSVTDNKDGTINVTVIKGAAA